MSRFNLKSLQKRTLSAVLLIPIAFWALYVGGWPLLILVKLCFLLVACEWAMLIPKMPCKKEKIAFSVVGALYIPFAFLCYFALTEFEYKFHLVVLIMIWASDIAAYFTGKIVGGPKLMPTLSPNKTWAGLGGALIGPALMALAVYPFFFPPIEEGVSPNPYSWMFLAVMGVVVGVSGQAGDLFISYLKRKAKVKDTGSLLPGHGGALDRLDSLMLASIVFTLVLFLVR